MSTRDRYRGTLVGTAVGDALGMPVEGLSREAIRARYGVVEEMLDARLGRGRWTDDTRMALDLARALVEAGGELDLDLVAERFAAGYDPRRGYGGNTRKILEAIGEGRPWSRVVEEARLPGGSWANGAAMRVAPVALAFHPDPRRVAGAAARQAEVTGHTHPVGRAGAQLQALAVHRALSHDPGSGDPESFLTVFDGFREEWPPEIRDALSWIARRPDAGPGEAVRSLGTGGRASASVPAALWCFLSVASSPAGTAERVVVRAVNLGGDTDTVGAMAGSLAGAAYGASAFPGRWIAVLEGGGEDGELAAVADALHALAREGPATGDGPPA